MTDDAAAPLTAERPARRVAFAPGRVNLIGDHTDYAAGLALPMAIDLGTTIDVVRGGDRVELTSDAGGWAQPVSVPIDLDEADVATFAGWARHVAAVAAVCRPEAGGRGTVRTTLPVGAGLSSSAALEVALALALGHRGPPMDLAHDCRRAEHLAVGVPCGLMDQLISVHGVAGHALLVDFSTERLEPVPLPDGVAVLVVHSGVQRALADTPYSQRRAETEAAADVVGPLQQAGLDEVAAIREPLLRRRARHVVTENARVRAVAAAFASGDVALAGHVLGESQRSLRDDMEVSSAELDHLVDEITRVPGVYGARITGAGFGGCVVALAAEDAAPPGASRWWRVRPSAGAHVLDSFG